MNKIVIFQFFLSNYNNKGNCAYSEIISVMVGLLSFDLLADKYEIHLRLFVYFGKRRYNTLIWRTCFSSLLSDSSQVWYLFVRIVIFPIAIHYFIEFFKNRHQSWWSPLVLLLLHSFLLLSKSFHDCFQLFLYVM